MDERENITNEEAEAEKKNINAEMENIDTEEKAASAVIPPEEEVEDDFDDFDDFAEDTEESVPEKNTEETDDENTDTEKKPNETDFKLPNEKEKKNKEKKPKNPLPWKKIGIAAGIVIGICAAAYLGGAAYYNSHFYPGTNLGNFNCANLTVEQAKEKIENEMNNYVYTINEREGKKEYIHGSDIDLKCTEINGVEEAKENQNPFGWLTNKAGRNQQVNVSVSYDEDKLYQIAEGLECAVESRTNMDGAEAGVYYQDGSYHMREVEGKNIISFTKFYSALKAGVYGTYRDMSLEDEGIYVNMADEDKLKAAIEEMNKCVSAKITYTKGDQTYFVDGGSINTWLTLNKDYTVSISDEGINQYISELAAQFDTVGSWRTFKPSIGDTATVGGGDYGWKIDKTKEAEELKQNIRDGVEITREPIYSKKGFGARGSGSDIPNTYVEVSIANQRMWFYKDGALVVASNVVTGDVTKGNGTHTGIFSLKYKERNATLKGENYSTPVSYWMPFNGGEGLHDAYWRGAFGGSIYKGGGSHGCVNLPPAVAETVFSNIQPGTPVIVY